MLEKDRGGNDVLDVATHAEERPGVPHRLALYQQVIADAKAEPEDKSYALYRAVMCYAPSGYNDCGGKDVDKAVRKALVPAVEEPLSSEAYGPEISNTTGNRSVCRAAYSLCLRGRGQPGVLVVVWRPPHGSVT